MKHCHVCGREVGRLGCSNQGHGRKAPAEMPLADVQAGAKRASERFERWPKWKREVSEPEGAELTDRELDVRAVTRLLERHGRVILPVAEGRDGHERVRMAGGPMAGSDKPWHAYTPDRFSAHKTPREAAEAMVPGGKE